MPQGSWPPPLPLRASGPTYRNSTALEHLCFWQLLEIWQFKSLSYIQIFLHLILEGLPETHGLCTAVSQQQGPTPHGTHQEQVTVTCTAAPNGSFPHHNKNYWFYYSISPENHVFLSHHLCVISTDTFTLCHNAALTYGFLNLKKSIYRI